MDDDENWNGMIKELIDKVGGGWGDWGLDRMNYDLMDYRSDEGMWYLVHRTASLIIPLMKRTN